MIRQFEKSHERYHRLNKWHPWFAWHPILWDGGFAWFSTVERSLKSTYNGQEWFYRLPGSTPTEREGE